MDSIFTPEVYKWGRIYVTVTMVRYVICFIFYAVYAFTECSKPLSASGYRKCHDRGLEIWLDFNIDFLLIQDCAARLLFFTHFILKLIKKFYHYYRRSFACLLPIAVAAQAAIPVFITSAPLSITAFFTIIPSTMSPFT